MHGKTYQENKHVELAALADAVMAYAEGRMLKDVALEQTDLTREELDRILDPRGLTEGGIHE